MAWISAAALLEEYVYDDRQCDICNSSTINLISGSELTCLTCGRVTSVSSNNGIVDYSLQSKDGRLRPILFDKSKLSSEWRTACNQLKISDDNFLRAMLHERRRFRRKIANNRKYFMLLIGSLYYIQKRNSGSCIFISDIINRLGLSNVSKKFARVIYEISNQLNIKIHSQSIRVLVANLLCQLASNRYVEYSKVSNVDTFNPNTFLSQIISDSTLTLESSRVAVSSTTLSNFITENNKLIVDLAVEILQKFQLLDGNLKIVDDVLASEWRQYGYSSKITLAIAIHMALYKIAINLPVKEYVTLLGINRSSFYRRRKYIQKLVTCEDSVIPLGYFTNLEDLESGNKVKQSENYLKKETQLLKEVSCKYINLDRKKVTITNDNRSQSIVCRYQANGKIKKRCFSLKRYGIEGATKLAQLFKSSHINNNN